MNNNNKRGFSYSIVALVGFSLFAGTGYAAKPAHLASTSISTSEDAGDNNSQFTPGPIVLTKSNHNLLSVNKQKVTGSLYIYNNSDKSTSFNIVGSPLITIDPGSSCKLKTDPYKECQFRISYQGSGSGDTTVKFHITSDDTSGDDWFTVNAIDVPLGTFYRPDVQGTEAHSMPAFTSMAAIKKGSFTISYAGSYYGVYKSTDHGETWAPENAGLDGDKLKINDILSVDNDLYVGTGDGVMKWDNTTPQTPQWTKVGSGLNSKDAHPIQKLLIVNKKLFAGVQQDDSSGSYDVCIYQLELDASSPAWTKSCNPSKFSKQSTDEVTGLVYFDNNKLLVSTNNDGIRAFETNQKTWEDLNDGLPGLSMSSLVSYDKNLYASIDDYGVYKWDNEKQSWQAENKGLDAPKFELVNPLLSATDKGLYVSLGHEPKGTPPYNPTYSVYKLNTDGWQPAASGQLPSSLHPRSFVTDNDYLYLYIPTHGFFYRSSVQQIKWEPMSTLSNVGGGISTILNNSATSELFIGGSGGVFKSNDQGANWFYQSGSNDRLVSVSSLLLVPNSSKPSSGAAYDLYAGTDSLGVFQWEYDQTDKQGQWKLVGGETCDATSLTYFGGTLHLGSSGSSYVQTSYGVYSLANTWKEVVNHSDDVSGIHSILSFNNSLYAGSLHGLFRLIETENRWEKIPLEGAEEFTTLFSDGTDLYTGTEMRDKTDNVKVFVLPRDGKWKDISSGLPNVRNAKVSALAAIDRVLFAGLKHNGGDSGLYRKNDDSSDWKPYAFNNSDVLSLLSIGKNLYVGVDAGLNVAQVKE